jgi:serine/threonine protein kinase
MWALGVTFFEILVGRTPFEYEEGEQFASKADLEKYWSRTVSVLHLARQGQMTE